MFVTCVEGAIFLRRSFGGAIEMDVLHLVFLTEKINAAATEGQMSPREAVIIQECATELLNAVRVAAEVNVDQFVIPFL